MLHMDEKPQTDIHGLDLEQDRNRGVLGIGKLPVTIMWTDAAFEGLIANLHAVVGTKQLTSALHHAGLMSAEDDWRAIAQSEDPTEVLGRLAGLLAVTGWGHGRLTSLDLENKQAHFTVENSWEGRYQKEHGECWGSAMLAGKLAGYGERVFGTMCNAKQVSFLANGDPYDEFIVQPAPCEAGTTIDDSPCPSTPPDAKASIDANSQESQADVSAADGSAVDQGNELSAIKEELRQQNENLRASEQARAESEERWQFALEGAGDGVWDWNALTDRVYFSHQWKAMLGYTDKEIGDTLNDWDRLVHPEDKQMVYTEINKHFNGDTPIYTSEHRVLCRDGTYKWILDRGKVITRTPDGKPLRVIGTHADISKLKQIEQALSTRETLLSSILESTADGIIVVNSDGEVLTINERLCEICGISHDDAQSWTNQQFIDFATEHVVDRDRFLNEITRLNQTSAEGWLVLELKDGRYFELYSRALIMEGVQGRLWSLRDITAQQVMEDELRDSQAYSRSLFADSNIPLVVLDPETGCYTDCNQAAVDIYKFPSREAVLGRQPIDFSAPTQYDGTPSEIAAAENIQASLTKNSHRFEWRHQRPNGEIWDAEVELMRFRHLQHDYLQFSLQDITQRKRVERRNIRLNQLNEALLKPGSLSAKMDLITDALVEILEADFARIWLINPGDRCNAGCIHAAVTEGPHVCINRQRCLHLISSSGRYTHLDGKMHARVPFGCYKIGRVAAAEELGFVTNEVTTDSRVHDHAWALSLGLVSFAGYRLVAADGSPSGVLALFCKRELAAEDIAVIETIANTTSLVVQTAQAEETLRLSEDKFSRAFRASPDALVINRVEDGVIIDVNGGFCNLTGHQPDEAIGRTTSDLGLWVNQEDRLEIITSLKANGRFPETERRFRTKTGAILDCTIATEIIYIGADLCGLSIIRDITEHKQAQLELLNEKQFTEKLLDSMPGIFFLYDANLRLKRWNKAHELAMGFTADELNNWYIGDWHRTPDEVQAGLAHAHSVIETGVGGQFETNLVNKEGQYVPYLITTTGLMTPDGPMLMGVGIDTTEQKRVDEALRQSEKRFRSIALNLPGVVYQFYARNTGEVGFHFISDRVLDILGEDTLPDDVFGHFIQGIPPDERQHFIDSVNQAIKDVSPWEFEGHFVQPSGKRLYVHVMSQPEQLEDAVMFYGVLLDITDKRLAEEEREQLTAILDNASDLVAITSPAGQLLYLNAAGRRMIGWSDDEQVVTRFITDFLKPEAAHQLLEEAFPVAAQKGCWQGETTILGREDREIPVSQTIMAHSSAERNVEYYSTIVRDITELKHAEMELRESEERYRNFIANASEGIFRIDVEPPVSIDLPRQELEQQIAERAVIGEANAALSAMYGLTPDQMIGHHVAEYAPNCGAQIGDLLASADYRIAEREELEYSGNGEPIYIVESYSGTVVDGKITRVWGVQRDITARKHAEQALAVSENKYRMLVEMAREAVWVTNENHVLTFTNSSGAEMLGYSVEQMVGRPMTDFLFQEDEHTAHWYHGDQFQADSNTYEQRYRHADGSEIWCIVSATPISSTDGEYRGALAILMDISARKRAEQERLEIERRLLHSQKLESLGVLAGGIAHDFNNLLMAIIGNLDLAMIDMSRVAPARQYITQAMQASRRASDLTRQMLAYSGKGRFVMESLDLAELVLENAHLLRASMAKTVSFSINAVSGLSLIEADPGQVQQVIMNLITNASEALGEQAGVISITTGESEFDEAYFQQSRVDIKPPAGRYVFAEVADDGCGMDSETIRRLFDPFFTTKFTGRGLGMAAVLGIIRGHRGAIIVDSAPGQGSVIRVLFPVSNQIRLRKTTEQSVPSSPAEEKPVSGTVLIVDDEEPVRVVCRSFINMLGFTTICARDGEEGVHLFQKHAEEIVCVVLDLNMPRMDGVSAFREMKRLKPDLRVILCSGYNEQEATQQFYGEGLAAFIQKPFRLDDLKQKLEQIYWNREPE